MSLPAYAQYQESGIAWLGNVPAQWSIQPFYSLASERNESNKGMLEDNLLSLSYGRVVRKDIGSNDGLLPESFETYQIVRAGDIIFRLTDLQNDKRSLRTARVQEDGIITSAYLSAIPMAIESRYLSYLLRSYDITKVFYSMGGGLRQSMKFSDIKRVPILVPSFNEQIYIAAFLDREAAKIDALVSEQEKLITLLAEKRQATISHAVTKGLNSDAPMKDSGVEWLGEVPKHWSVVPAKRVASVFVPQRNKPELNEDANGIFWVTMEDVKGARVVATNLWVSAEACTDAGTRVLKSGAVIASCVGNFGVAAINAADVIINQQLQAYIPKSSEVINTEFLRYLVVNSKSYFESIGTSATLIYVNQQGFGELPLPLPSLDEQLDIVLFLVRELGRLEALTSKAETGIGLLKERRSGLISAAVTGKIDVRQASQQEQTKIQEAA